MSSSRTLITSTEELIRQGFNAQAHSRPAEAITLMEAAFWFARGAEADQIRDTLAALYIAENDTPRLARIFENHTGELSAELVKGALALLRNRALGTLETLPPQCERSAVLTRMRQCFDVGAYDVASALFILSMLLQIRETDLAVELAHSLFDASVRVDESVIAKVLAALVENGRFSEARDTLTKAVAASRMPSGVYVRLMSLIALAEEGTPANLVPGLQDRAGDDKVVQFLSWRFTDSLPQE